MDTDAHRSNRLTEQVIGCAYRVSNTLGVGFLEKVYENALAIEIAKAGLRVEQQKALNVHYDGRVVGEYIADLLVEGELLLELKAVKSLEDVHVAQCINYLKAAGFPMCLLLNFGTARVQVRRIRND